MDTTVQSSGPLWTSFLVDPSDTPNGAGVWWAQAYTNPDVALNHPQRWTWTLYLGLLEAQRSVTHATNGTRRVFVYLTEGELAVDGARLYTKDQGRIDAEAPLTLAAHTDTRFVLIDVPSCRGWGYDQATLQGARG